MFSPSQTDAVSQRENGRDFASFGTRASGIARQAEGRLAEAADLVKTVVDNRPLLALGAALAAGVLLGWLIKRR